MALVESKVDDLITDFTREQEETKVHRNTVLEKLSKQDRILYVGMGILATLQVLVPFLLK